MKTRCALFILMLAMVLCACDAKRRAQRRIRRIVERCPELVQVQAHPIDTLLAVPSVADSARVPLTPLLDGRVLTVTTPQGMFTAAATDDSLKITYNAEQEPVHYSDTLRYSQVVVTEEPPKDKPSNFFWFLLGLVIGLIAILAIIFAVIIKTVKAS